MSTVIEEPVAVQTRDEIEDDLIPAPIVLQFKPVIHFTDEQFGEFCSLNSVLRIEMTAQGEIVVMPPAFSETGDKNSEINMQLRQWAKRDGTGRTFDSSAGFKLPNKSILSPDASWISNARWNQLTDEERSKFALICPEFVIELRSHSDRIRDLKAKMQEYLDNGTQLGLLIIPEQKRVYIYQPNKPVEVLDNRDSISCDPLLPGFELVVKEIW